MRNFPHRLSITSAPALAALAVLAVGCSESKILDRIQADTSNAVDTLDIAAYQIENGKCQVRKIPDPDFGAKLDVHCPSAHIMLNRERYPWIGGDCHKRRAFRRLDSQSMSTLMISAELGKEGKTSLYSLNTRNINCHTFASPVLDLDTEVCYQVGVYADDKVRTNFDRVHTIVRPAISSFDATYKAADKIAKSQ